MNNFLTQHTSSFNSNSGKPGKVAMVRYATFQMKTIKIREICCREERKNVWKWSWSQNKGRRKVFRKGVGNF